jgi:hypothetical protein
MLPSTPTDCGILPAITGFFHRTAKDTFTFSQKAAPLSEVTALWNEKEQATRIVFQP